MDIAALYDFAAQKNIEVIRFPMADNGSMSLMAEGGNCYIGIDPSVQDGSVKERTHLSHEIGHCETGSFYNKYAAVDSRQRHENRADKWAIKNLIPIDALDDAIAAGHTELWQLAELFGVSESLMRRAVCYYVHGNLAADLYF